MSDIFISYRRKDGWVLANLLYEKLRNLGYKVFLDTRDSRIAQRDFEPVIEENIKETKDHLIIISPESFKVKDNDQYLKEIESTITDETVGIIPIVTAESNVRKIYENLRNSEANCLRRLADKTIIEISNDSTAFPGKFDNIIRRLRSSPSNETTALTNREAIENRFSLRERWKDASEICICAHGIESILTQESPFFEQMINSGVKFRIVCVSPESDSANYIANNNIREGTERKRQRVISNSHDLILDYLDDEKYANQIEYRLTTLKPECIIMIVKRSNGISNIKVDYVVTSNDAGNTRDNKLFSKTRRCVYIDDSDMDNYSYYCEVFEYIWNHSCTRKIEVS